MVAPPPAHRRRNVPMWAAAIAGALVLGLLAVHFWAQPLPGLGRLDRFASDARFRMRGPRAPATADVVVVGVDDEARRAAPDLGPTRKGWARFLRALADYRPKVIALDLFFSRPERILPPDVAGDVRAARDALAAEATPTTTTTGAGSAGRGSDSASASPALAPPAPTPAATQAAAALDRVVDELAGDAELADAIAKAGTVVLGANFHIGGPTPRLIVEPLGLSRGRHPEVIAGGARGPRWPQRATGVDFTIEPLARVAAGAGAVNSYRDDDLVLRRVPLAIEMPPHFYMPLGMAAVAAARGPESMLGAQLVAGADTLRFAGREVPVGQSASLPLDFPGRGRIPHLSAASVLDGTAPRGALEGKIVFVGLTYAAFDKIATPLDPLDEGVDMHAVLAENLLSGRLLRTAEPPLPFAAAVVLVLISVGLQARRVRRRAILPVLAMLAAMLGWVALTYHLFVSSSLLVSTAPPLVAAATVMLVALVAALATEGREKLELRSAFSRYVSGAVVERIMADPSLARLGGQRRELTVLFSDIRGFSGFSEQMRPEELAAFLSEYLTPMTDLVMAADGTLDKYIGDALMAIWGAPIEGPDHARRACATALAMQARLVELNRTWEKQGKPAIAIGIGINTGPMAVGNMGSRARFDYTVMGDAVNLGARLEGLTKEYDVGILCGEATAEACRDAFLFRELGRVRVKGRAAAAPVFELLGPIGTPAPVNLTAWHAAMARYASRDFAAAAEAFDALAATGDRASVVLAARSRDLADHPPPADWDGVYEQRGK